MGGDLDDEGWEGGESDMSGMSEEEVEELEAEMRRDQAEMEDQVDSSDEEIRKPVLGKRSKGVSLKYEYEFE